MTKAQPAITITEVSSTISGYGQSGVGWVLRGVAFRSIIDTGGDLDPLLARWRDEAAQFAKEKAPFEHPGYASRAKARNLQSVK